MMATKQVIVKQEPNAEVPTEVLAGAILAISVGLKQLRSGRLNDKALVLLIQHAAPSFDKHSTRSVTVSMVKAVLEGIESLEATYLKKK
ncbi:MAG: hypothetical protein KGL39_39830 [Patescibacteria group bacterium]|nr:hypothetical protein [Patescibacteria group bacterium]